MSDAKSSDCYRVLALDGGGIRGYYTAALLSKLATHYGSHDSASIPDLGAGFDLICGTSAGAILAGSLAAGVPIDRIAALYRCDGRRIFPDPSPITWRNMWWCARHWWAPSADAAALRAALAGSLGDETLDAVFRRRGIALCLTTTDIRRCQVRVLRTPHRSPDDGAMPLVDACMASSAAPILLPPVRFPAERDELLCDGGITMNNPVMIALLEALAVAGPGREIRLLSVSSCSSVGREGKAGRSRSIGFWISGLRLLHLSLDTQSKAAAECARMLAPVLVHPTHVFRLLDPPISQADAELLRIDNATPDTFDAMDRLAQEAAVLNIEAASGGSEDLAWLPNFFRPRAAPAAQR